MTDLTLQEAVENGNRLIAEISLQPNELLFLTIASTDDPTAEHSPTIYLTKAQTIQLRDFIESLLADPSR